MLCLASLHQYPLSLAGAINRAPTSAGARGVVFPGVLACVLLAGCAAPQQEAPRLRYLCQHGQQFEARLYEDAALLQGQNAQQQLARVEEDGGALSYSDGALHALFGLGGDGREARLRYAGIPHEVHCRRIDGADAVRATPRQQPKPAQPEGGEEAPRELPTNLRTSGGRDSMRGN